MKMGKPSNQVVLEEEFDENYEPTEEETNDYAKFLGMDPEKEKHLLWIARESLKAPLPPNWKPCQTEDGNIYYFNFQSGESIWDHPCDEHYRKLYEREKAKGPPASQRPELPPKDKPAELKPIKGLGKAAPLPSLLKPIALSKPDPVKASADNEDDWGGFDDDDEEEGEDDDILDDVLGKKTLGNIIKKIPPGPKRGRDSRVNDDDDDDFDLSSNNSDEPLPGRAKLPLTTPKKNLVDTKTVEQDERKRHDDEVHKVKAKWKAELERVEREEQDKASKEMDRIRKKYHDEITRVEKAEKEKMDQSTSTIRKEYESKRESVEQEEKRNFEKKAQEIKDEFARKLKTLEDEQQSRCNGKEAEYQTKIKLASDTPDIKKNEDALKEARNKYERELTELKREFADKRAIVERDERAKLEKDLDALKERLWDEYAKKDEQAKLNAEKRVREQHQVQMDALIRKLLNEREMKEIDMKQSCERETEMRINKLREDLKTREESAMEAERRRQQQRLDRIKAEWDERIRVIEEEAQRKEVSLKARIDGFNKADGAQDLSGIDLAALRKETELQLEQQRKQKEELEKEQTRLDLMEKDIKARRERLEDTEYYIDFGQIPQHIAQERTSVAALEADVLAQRYNVESERDALRVAQVELEALRSRIEAEKSALLRIEKETAMGQGRLGRMNLLTKEVDEESWKKNEKLQKTGGMATFDSGLRPQSGRKDGHAGHSDDLSAIYEDHDQNLRNLGKSLNPGAASKPSYARESGIVREDELVAGRLSPGTYRSDEFDETESDTNSASEAFFNDRSLSPTAQLERRIAEEDRRIEKAKKLLEKQNKRNDKRIKELEAEAMRYQYDIMSLAPDWEYVGDGVPHMNVVAGLEAEVRHSQQRPGTLNEIENELGKLLGLLRSSTSNTQRYTFPTIARAPDIHVPVPSRVSDALPPYQPIRQDLGSTTSVYRKRAWEVGHTRTEALIQEHSAWLTGFKARHAGILSR